MWLRHHRVTWFWLTALIGLASPWVAQTFNRPTQTDCIVSSIHDGDTLRARCGGTPIKVRFYCIDTPEMAQRPWGRESRDYLRKITPARVKIVKHATDRYGRVVGEVFAADRSLNMAMVEAGMAAVYRRYCPSHAYAQAEEKARAARLGIWSRPGLQQRPWDYRAQRRRQ